MSKRALNQDVQNILGLINKKGLRVHFIGVGGVGMYSLFEILKKRGAIVSGSDRAENAYVKRLISDGERVVVGHNLSLVANADLVVYTHAISDADEELALAKRLGKPTATRAVLLGAVISLYELKMGISGTHGKSTVTAMINHVIGASDISCDCICGADLGEGRGPFVINDSRALVYESCEYKDSFLNFYPDYAVFLNLELDHPDYFKGIEDIKHSFLRAMNNSLNVIVNADDENLFEISKKTVANPILVGRGDGCCYRLLKILENNGKCSFWVLENGGRVTKISLNLFGSFNVYNALCAYSLCREIGIEADRVKTGLESFTAIPRRLEYIGKYKNHKLYYDYAHHPTEIKASIKAIENAEGVKPCVIFRPHTYSRTETLFAEFCDSLSLADKALLLDIDGVREENKSGISSSALAEKIGDTATRVTKNDVLTHIDDNGSPIILMGAADLGEIKEMLLKNGKEKFAR